MGTRLAEVMAGPVDVGGAVVAGGGAVVAGGGGAVVGGEDGVPDKVQKTMTTHSRPLPSIASPAPMAFQVGLVMIVQWSGLAAKADMTLAPSGP